MNEFHFVIDRATSVEDGIVSFVIYSTRYLLRSMQLVYKHDCSSNEWQLCAVAHSNEFTAEYSKFHSIHLLIEEITGVMNSAPSRIGIAQSDIIVEPNWMTNLAKKYIGMVGVTDPIKKDMDAILSLLAHTGFELFGNASSNYLYAFEYKPSSNIAVMETRERAEALCKALQPLLNWYSEKYDQHFKGHTPSRTFRKALYDYSQFLKLKSV